MDFMVARDFAWGRRTSPQFLAIFHAPQWSGPDIQHASRGVLIRISFGKRDSSIGYNRAVPMAAAAAQVGNLRSARWIVDLQAAVRIVDIQQAAGDDGAGSTGRVTPHRCEFSAAGRPGGGGRLSAPTSTLCPDPAKPPAL